MIISKEVEIRINSSNFKYYSNLGYKDLKVNKIIIIPVEYLTKGSHVIVKVKCDICGTEKEIKYCVYYKNIKKHNKYCCSQKCAWIAGKNKKTNLERHGNENYNNREKYKQTCLDSFGVENLFQVEEIKEKSRQTCLENHGVEYSLQSPEIREKGKITKLEKYGNETYNNPKKYKQTCLDNFGVENLFQLEEIKELSKQTKKEKYDDENYSNRKKFLKTMNGRWDEVMETLKNTMMKKYGVVHNMQIWEFVKKAIETKTGLPYEEYIKQLPDFKKYERQILKFTRKQPLYLLKNIEKRGNSGQSGAYHLDHMFSVMVGFRDSIPPYIIGNIINLEMIPWLDNQIKNTNCSITKEELFERFDNNVGIKKDKLSSFY